MVCLGLEPRAAGWKAQMNPLKFATVVEVSLRQSSWLAKENSKKRYFSD